MGVPVRVGEVLGGKYRVERVLGSGGFGVVVAATHLHLGEIVAIKVLLADYATHAQIARFLREAKSAMRIKSEHVVRVFDAGVFDNGLPYIVMECLEGEDLGELLQRDGPLPIDEAVGFTLQACEAIAEAHALGIVHRDIKPSNLFLMRRRDGSPLIKVLDFGIAKAAGGESEGNGTSLTGTASVIGSPLYMSPEQVRSSKHVDARSDVWSLGIVLHELVGGASPFEGETKMAVLAAIAADAPIPLRTRRADAPLALEAIVLRCLEKDPSERFSTVAALALALAPFAPPDSAPLVARIGRILGTASSSPPARASASPPVEAFSPTLMASHAVVVNGATEPLAPPLASVPTSPLRATHTTAPVSEDNALSSPPTARRGAMLVGAAVIVGACALGAFASLTHSRSSVGADGPALRPQPSLEHVSLAPSALVKATITPASAQAAASTLASAQPPAVIVNALTASSPAPSPRTKRSSENASALERNAGGSAKPAPSGLRPPASPYDPGGFGDR